VVPVIHLGAPLGTIALIALGILAWALLAILTALFVARMISLRDRQHRDLTIPGQPDETEPGDGA
jgi:hypothetical protein